MLVFLRILVKPVTSSPTLDAPINFRSNEIVTQGAFPDALCAAVPAPASIKLINNHRELSQQHLNDFH